MNFNDALKVEERENNEDLYTISFYKESEWWRAYEWSAYLSYMFPNNLDDKLKIKATRRQYKGSNDGIVIVGLQLKSFGKYFPGIDISDINGNKFSIDVRKYFENTNFQIEEYKKILSDWKGKVPYCKSKEKDNKTNDTVINNSVPFITNGHTAFSVMGEILEYPLENKTPMDNYAFIRELKNHILMLIINK